MQNITYILHVVTNIPYSLIYKKKILLLYKTLKEIALSNNKLIDFYEVWNPHDALLINII